MSEMKGTRNFHSYLRTCCLRFFLLKFQFALFNKRTQIKMKKIAQTKNFLNSYTVSVRKLLLPHKS